MNPRKNLDAELDELRGRLAGARGKTYWRTLEELADSEAFAELIHREFPEQAAQLPDPVSRRAFLALMGASLGLAGLGGCSVRPAPARRIVPYVKGPEEVIPGKPLFYATAMTQGGSGVGLLVESHMGRPTKVEGNPEHPASRGATDVFHQASVLTLYDPDRSATVTRLGLPATWDDAFAALRDAAQKQRGRRGAGLRILSETVVSPTLARQVGELLEEFPEAKWHQYEPLARYHADRAATLAFGEPVGMHYDLRKADVVLALDADFLGCGPGSLAYVADFMERRRVRTSAAAAGRARMNRLYAVETALTCTGAKADHRLALPAREVEPIARAVAGRLGVGPGAAASGPQEKWVAAVAKDLEQHRGRCVVIAGERQPVAVHLLAHAINDRLGNVGTAVIHTAPVEARPVEQTASLRELADDMDAGRVEVLLILGGNPAYTAPADLRFAERLQWVPLRFHLSLYQDETSRLCHWHLPEAHYLEAWGDTRAYEGTASIAQPLIEPLYHGRSAHEVLSVLGHGVQTPGYEIVRDTWRRQRGSSKGDFDDFWEAAVHDGVVPGTAFAPKKVTLRQGWEKHLGPAPAKGDGYELVFQADPALYDGRWANNGWLQELPKPMTRLTWGNPALVSPATAKELGVGLGSYAHGGEHGGFHQPVVELRLGDRRVGAPVWVMPGHADGAVTVYLGHGRSSAGKVGDGVGFDAYGLRTTEHLWFAPGLDVRKTGERELVACTQQHHLMENRDVVRAGTLAEYKEAPRSASAPEREKLQEESRRARTPLTMYDSREYDGHRWGMAIDLTACVGCSACVVACQAENNIPVVGKEQVSRGREMHWLRVDHYNAGPYEAPTEFYLQPVPCMHCERAPCEYVCPTEATVHSADGLNDMVYQRCVGTRFCSNNCPYKVRRFNFFEYADFESARKMQYNPDVTVRSRGVMEKCSYCVQRIRAAEIGAQTEGRHLRDGEILTACQAACPAGAIIFGDISDPKSRVKQWKDSPLSYGLLADLNTRPRTTYLAALRNPNPELEA
jgi:molybdopterin-containing oxidoreductase family iron-sulfur binding subunit